MSDVLSLWIEMEGAPYASIDNPCGSNHIIQTYTTQHNTTQRDVEHTHFTAFKLDERFYIAFRFALIISLIFLNISIRS